MTFLGYEYKQEHESTMPDRRYFKKKTPSAAYNVHLVEAGNNFYYESILFRDILRTVSEVFEEYQKLKIELAKSYNDENEYALAKTEFVLNVLNSKFCQ